MPDGAIVGATSIEIDAVLAESRAAAFLLRVRICFRRHSAYRGDESISLAGDRDNVVMLISALTKRSAERGDLPNQVVLLHGRVRPHQAEQFILADDAVAMVEEGDENFERLRCDRYESIVAAQRSLHRIDDERTERIPAVDSRMRSGRECGGRLGPTDVLHGAFRNSVRRGLTEASSQY